MKFARKLRWLRERSRRSQQDMADEMAVSQSLYSTWERGKNTPDVFQAFRLARLLCTSLDFLADEALGEADAARSDLQRRILEAAEIVGEKTALERIMQARAPVEGPRLRNGDRERNDG